MSEEYSMLLEWDPVDRIYMVTVPELPGCRTHGRTRVEAVQQGQDAIDSWLDGAREANWTNWTIPAPHLWTPAGVT